MEATMATKKFNLAALSLAVLFVACGDDSGNNSNNSEKMEVVSSIYNLGDCTESLDGDTVFVKDKKADYICLDGEWQPLEEDDDEDEVSSSSKGGKSSGKGSSSSIKDSGDSSSSSSSDAEVDSLASSSSQKDSSNIKKDSVNIKDLTVSGLAQKGPFVNGSSIVLRELDGKTLVQTGKSFKGTVANDKGEYSLSDITLKSQYAHLEVNGYYLNEITGKKTTGQILLNALTDLSNRKKTNINILTHLEYDRVLYLVGTGLDFNDAKKQAENEVFKAFHIDVSEFGSSEDLDVFGETEADAALLAISILLQGDRNVAELTELLKNISTDLSKDGEWNDSATIVKIADWAYDKRAVLKENDSLGIYMKFVNQFLSDAFGLGLCGSDSVPIGTIKRIVNEKSMFYNVNYDYRDPWGFTFRAERKIICRDATYAWWDDPTLLEIDRYEWNPENTKDGMLLVAPVSGYKMVWDSDSLRYAGNCERSINRGCTSYDVGKFFVVGKSEYAEYGYECREKSAMNDVLMIKRDESKYGKLTDSRDGQTYYTIKIGNQIWMAEDLNFDYKIQGSSYDNRYGRKYTWAAAMDSAGLYSINGKGCGYYSSCSKKYPIQGVCPKGWHLPTIQEWDSLYQATGSSPYALQAKGISSSATDSYGFSATDGTSWWSATDYGKANAYGWDVESGKGSYSKSILLHVRCLKDNEVEDVLGACVGTINDSVGVAFNDYYICDDNVWRTATTYEKDTYRWKDTTDGAIKKGNVTDILYRFEKNKWEIYSPCGDLWCGKNKDYRVNTGISDNSNSYGYWIDFTDEEDGGESQIIYPANKSTSSKEGTFEPIIDKCEGSICGQFELKKGRMTFDPFVGVGFTLSEDGKSAKDMTDWGGICISYQTDYLAYLEIGLGETEDSNLGYDLPYVTLAKSTEVAVKDFSWSQFQQAGWGDGKISGTEAATKAVQITFKIQQRDRTSGNFAIYSVGRYGTCK